MMAHGFLLDENVNPRIRDGVLRINAEIPIWCVGDPGAPRRNTPDPEILVWCEDNDCVLVTNNRASMPGHLFDHLQQDRHIPGILIMKDIPKLGEVIEELVMIWGASFPDEYADRISHLPLSR